MDIVTEILNVSLTVAGDMVKMPHHGNRRQQRGLLAEAGEYPCPSLYIEPPGVRFY